MTIDEAAVRRIRGLLAKAEGTDNPHEAEAFSAKAFELMDKYRIDMARVRPEEGPNIGRTPYVLAGNRYLRASLALLGGITQHYGVIILAPSTGNSKNITLVGDQDDVRMAVMMFESLILQRDRACLADPVPYGINTNKHRNSFCYGYAVRIHRRLKEIRDAARKAATTTNDSTALVLMNRLDVVAEHLGNPGARNHNAPKVDPHAAARGDAAATTADLGQSRVGASTGPKALGR